MVTGAAAAALLAAVVASGANAARPVASHEERVFRTADGLPQATVNAIAQTPDGYLWLGTDGGLARFDGRRFLSFTADDTPALRLDRVQALLVDGRGDLWVGTYGGAGLARVRGGAFETFEDRIGRGSRVASAFRARDGTLWFGRASDVVRVRDGRFEVMSRLGEVKVSTVQAFAEEADGTLWVGMLTGLVRMDRTGSRAFPHADGEPLTPVTALVADAGGRIWGGTEHGGLFRVVAGDPRAVVVPAQRPHRAVRRLALDRAGRLWAATDGGLMRVDEAGLHPVCARCASAEPARAVTEDREGNLWVGTHGAGLVRITRAAFEAIALDGVTTRRALSVIEARDGSVWIGTDGGGLVRASRGVLTRHTRAEHGLCTDFVWALTEDNDGALWVGGEHGGRRVVCRLDPATRAVTTLGPAQGLPQGAVRALTVTRDGRLWIGTMRALYRRDGDRVVRVPIPTAPGGSMPVYAIHEDAAGVLWVGGSHGLHGLREGRWTALRGPDGLSNEGVFSIDEDAAGGLWLGTLRGFSLVRQGRAHGFRREQGFHDEPVFKVLPDGVGRLWLCSPRGLASVPPPEPGRAPAPGLATLYRAGSGLPADQCEGGEGQGAGFRAPGGRMFFPVGRNVVVIDPRRLPEAPAPAAPLVEEVRADGAPVAAGGRARIPPGRGDLQIEYTAPALTRPDRLRFRYRLSPLDAGWVEAGDRRVALYTKVPPGRYLFEVAAAPDGLWSGAPAARVALEWLPHLHQRAWFRALAAALGAALMAALALGWHRRRMRMLERQHELVLTERTRIARDLHDTLAQGFTGISVQLEAASGWLARQEPARALEQMDKARALVRASLTDARRAVWDLGPEALARGGIVPALSEIARAFGDTIPVRIQVDGRPRRLPEPVEAALVRIGQEALTNAIRHAAPRNVALEIAFLDRELRLRVWDDGRGFAGGDEANEPGHLGLAGIRARARAIGASLGVKSAPNEGTQIAVSVSYDGEAPGGAAP